MPVTIIPTVKSVDPPEIVLFLQDLLEQARNGEITEFLAVTLNEDGEACYTCSGITNAFQLLGMMNYAMQSLFHEVAG